MIVRFLAYIGLHTGMVLFLIMSVVSHREVKAQNLVPNPSFEEINECPGTMTPVGLPGTTSPVKDWYGANTNTTDYFNACANFHLGGSPYAVPANSPGYQQARTGNAYMGAHILHYDPVTGRDQREYLQTRLITPLTAGHTYQVTFWVSRANRYSNGHIIEHIGAHFSPQAVMGNTPALLLLTPQVVNQPGNFLADTLNWMQVTDTFIAQGGEEYMVIGNFLPGFAQSFQQVGTGVSGYYYVDDVCVYDITGNTSATDTLVCAQDFLIRLTGSAAFSGWKWNTGDTGWALNVNTPGTYWVRSFNDCKWAADTFHIRHTPTPPFSLGKDTAICDGSPAVLHAPGMPGIRWEWGDGSTEAIRTITQSGSYHIRVWNGDCTSTDDINIRIGDFAQYLGRDTTLCITNDQKPVRLEARVPPQATVRWSTGTTGPVLEVKDSGTYWVQVSDFVCSAADTIRINAERCACIVRMPNAFTPNGDGKNDVFRAVFENDCPVTDFYLRIYNRYGALVFQTSNPYQGWDGQFNGDRAEAGTYFYDMRMQHGTGLHQLKKTGDVVLIR